MVSQGIAERTTRANLCFWFWFHPCLSPSSLCSFLGQACKDVGRAAELVGTFANACCGMVMMKRFEKLETNHYTLRVMSGALILFDHLKATGVFAKSSGVQIKGCVNQIRAHLPDTQNLLSAIQYNSKNFKSADENVKKLFVVKT